MDESQRAGRSSVLLSHNTSVAAGVPFHIDPAGQTVSDVVTRKNLFIGTAAPRPAVHGVMIRCDVDSDGYAWARGPAR